MESAVSIAYAAANSLQILYTAILHDKKKGVHHPTIERACYDILIYSSQLLEDELKPLVKRSIPLERLGYTPANLVTLQEYWVTLLEHTAALYNEGVIK